MAYFKGNASFTLNYLSVTSLDTEWTESSGSYKVYPINTGSVFMDGTVVNLRVWRLQHLIALDVNAIIKPSTLPYTGAQNSTVYLYSPRPPVSFADIEAGIPLAGTVITELPLDLSASAISLFTGTGIVTDVQSDLYINPESNVKLAYLFVDGRTSDQSTRLVIYYPFGFLPNHTIYVRGIVYYDPR